MEITEITPGDNALLDRAVVRLRNVTGVDHGLFLAAPGTISRVGASAAAWLREWQLGQP
jgi:hypothetical protein